MRGINSSVAMTPVTMRSTPSISGSLARVIAFSEAEMLALLDRVLAHASALDLAHSIVAVDRTRIRRRALPISE